MREELRQAAERLWHGHPGKTAGLAMGLMIGIVILCFGFWSTLFVAGCGIVGLWIGVQLDRGEDVLGAVGHWLDRLLRRSRW